MKNNHALIQWIDMVCVYIKCMHCSTPLVEALHYSVLNHLLLLWPYILCFQHESLLLCKHMLPKCLDHTFETCSICLCANNVWDEVST